MDILLYLNGLLLKNLNSITLSFFANTFDWVIYGEHAVKVYEKVFFLHTSPKREKSEPNEVKRSAGVGERSKVCIFPKINTR